MYLERLERSLSTQWTSLTKTTECGRNAALLICPTMLRCSWTSERKVSQVEKEIAQAGTIFVNGPVGAYENALFEKGTKSLWNAIADAPGFSVVGGGDSVTAASRFVENPAERFGYICTAGGAMVRFLSGVELPLITALRKAYGRKY